MRKKNYQLKVHFSTPFQLYIQTVLYVLKETFEAKRAALNI